MGKFKVQPIGLDSESGGLWPASPVPPTPIKPKNLSVSPLRKTEKNQDNTSTNQEKKKNAGGKRKLPNWLAKSTTSVSPPKRVKKEPEPQPSKTNTQNDTQNSIASPSPTTPSSPEHEETTANTSPPPPNKSVPLRTVKEILADLDRQLAEEISLEENSSPQEGSPGPSRRISQEEEPSLIHEETGE